MGKLSAQRGQNSVLAHLKANGELNPKYPGGTEEQKRLLEAEGYTVLKKGRTNIKYFVKDYEKFLFEIV